NLATFRELGDKIGVAMSLHRLGRIACDRGEYDQADTLYHQCLDISREVGNRPVIAFALGGIAGVAAARGEFDLAARLFGVAQALLDTISSTLESVGVAQLLPVARAGLGEAAWEGAWAEGKAMSMEEAIHRLLREAQR